MNSKKTQLKTYFKNHFMLYLMMVPGVVALVVFCYVPMYGIIIAFQDFNVFEGYFGSPWVGLKHFQTLFSDPYFFRLMKNTFLLGMFSFLVSFPAPLILALVINECRLNKFKSVVQSISYLPHFIPMVVMVGIMIELFGSYGVVNSVLNFFGIESISFFLKYSGFVRCTSVLRFGRGQDGVLLSIWGH